MLVEFRSKIALLSSVCWKYAAVCQKNFLPLLLVLTHDVVKNMLFMMLQYS